MTALDFAARAMAAQLRVSSRRREALDRLARAHGAAAQGNPRSAGPAAGVAVTAEGTALPAGLTSGYLHNNLPGLFEVGGGLPTVASNHYRLASAIVGTSGGNVGLNNGRNASCGRWRFMTDAERIAVRVGPTTAKYRFIVDGRYADLTGTGTVASGGSASEYIGLDFGSGAVREVIVETQQNCGFLGVYCKPTEKVWSPEQRRPASVILGDSYVYGSTAAHLGDGYGAVLADWLGTRNTNSGSGGTGWATDGGGAAYRFDQRIANGDLELGGTPDLVILTGSYNDRAQPAAAVTANCLAGLRTARARHPDVPIAVLGVFPASSGPSPQVADCEGAVKAAFDAFADPFSVFVPITQSTAVSWITGTGKAGSATGSGNADRMIDADGVHLHAAGHLIAGQRAARAVAAGLEALRIGL